MTIGPEPSTRILFRSSRRGTERPQEFVEQVKGVVRAGAGFGVVLHAARGDVEQADALDRAVVEVHVRELRRAEVGLDDLPRLALNREPVVLARDRDAAGAEVLDGVIRAA